MRGAALEQHIQEACSQAQNFLQDHDQNIKLRCERYKERQPHPEGQEAFTVWAQYPWHRDFHTRVMVEVTMVEKILLEPLLLPVIHTYGEAMSCSLFVYRLEEIISEKICAILQYGRKLHEQGWGRSRARDYYDLWRILTQFQERLDVNLLPSMVEEKSKKRGVIFSNVEDLFSEDLLRDLETSWIKWMTPIVSNLPEEKLVVLELKTILQKLWS